MNFFKLVEFPVFEIFFDEILDSLYVVVGDLLDVFDL